jgi:hypothetical protein
MARPGCSDFKVLCSSLSASVNDAAANTVAGPDALVAADDAADALDDVVAVLLSELHAPSTTATDSASTEIVRRRADIAGHRSPDLRSDTALYLAEQS